MPWIIAGYTAAPPYSELLVAWFDPLQTNANLAFAESSNGGDTWTGSPDLVEDITPPPTVTNGGYPQLAIGDNTTTGPIYLAYMNGGNISILRGTDTSSSTNTGWEFDHLKDASSVDIVVPRTGVLPIDVPGLFKVISLPQIAVDPSDASKLYLVYQDVALAGGGDVDIFCRLLTNMGTYWDLGDAVRVNDDPVTVWPPDDKDQVLPAVEVDTSGRVHIVFYDDRKYSQDDLDTSGIAFDVYYAVSLDSGVTFTNVEFGAIPKEPALQSDLTPLSGGSPTPGEYPGIACHEDTVWVAFSGTWSGEEISPGVFADDRSVIYVSRVKY